MRPSYERDVFPGVRVEQLIAEVSWLEVTPVRRECFMAESPTNYTYGSGRGARTYESTPYHPAVAQVQQHLNETLDCRYNVCFLNYYRDEKQHLGWHADDTPGMLHSHPIAVVSLGAPREIWWRRTNLGHPSLHEVGTVPPERRQLLESGSLFIMPAGFQQLYHHRIPKADRPCGPRVSLTFRRYEPEAP